MPTCSRRPLGSPLPIPSAVRGTFRSYIFETTTWCYTSFQTPNAT